MGMTVCQRHGRQPMDFAAKSLASSIQAHEPDLANPPAWLLVDFLGGVRECPVDAAFIKAERLQTTSLGSLVHIDNEDRAWEILESMAFVCRECLSEYKAAFLLDH